MKLKYFNAEEIVKNVKCAIHKTGKLGFSSAAIDKLGLTSNKSVIIAMNEENPEDQNLYVIIMDTITPQAFPLTKGGDYYYINTKEIFDSLGIDYRNKRIIYDIVDFTLGDQKMYKLIKREVKNKK